MTATRSLSSDRLRYALAAVVLVAASYGNSLNSPFHFDDFHSIQDNAWLKDLRHVGRYFTDVAVFSPLEENRAYRPFLLLGFALSRALSGGALWGYHLITLILHAAGAVVVGRLARRFLLAGGARAREAEVGGLLAVAVFAVHPILSEAINYISARSSLQAAVLSFASVLAYVRAREQRERRWFVVAAIALLLAMGTKVIAMTVPALLIGWEVALGPSRGHLLRDGARSWAARLGPLLVITVGFTVLHEILVGPAGRVSRGTLSPSSYFLTQVQVYLRFLGLFVWPEDLCADLTMPWAEKIYAGPVARALLANLALIGGALALRHRRPLVPFGVFWFYVTLAPTNSIVPLSEPATEHRVYIAFPGVLFALLGLLAPIAEAKVVSARARRVVIGAVAVVVLALGARTFFRNRVWQDDEALWKNVVEQAPDNGRAHLNYGLALMSRGELDGARKSFDRCAAAWPGYAFCYINRAVLALHERRLPDAEREIATAERLAPGNIYVLLWRGKVERAFERWPRAEAALRRALIVAPGHAEARRLLAFAVFMQGRMEEAERQLAALDQEGNVDGDLLYALGFLADRRGDRATATARYRAALAKDAQQRSARFNLAVALQADGKVEEAIVEYEALARVEPVVPDALFNLALAYWQRGDADRARAVRAELARRAPTYPGLASLKF